MPIPLTDEQRVAVTTPGNTWIVACPGSGKTRVALAKALREAPLMSPTGASVLMLSFSVTAKDEVARRVAAHAGEELRSKIEVATIHGFCLGNLILPFGDKIAGIDLRLTLAGSKDYDHALVESARANEIDVAMLTRHLAFRRRGPDGRTFRGAKESTSLEHAAVVDFWERLLRAGYVDYPNALYVSLQILRSLAWIREGLAASFPLIIVDEFQDCTDIQVSLIGELVKGGSRVVLVGDLHQCVYGFAGADVETLAQFAQSIDAKARALLGSHRCPSEIISVAERVFVRNIVSIGEAAMVDGRVIYDHSAQPVAAIARLVKLCDESGVVRNEVAFVCSRNDRLEQIVDELGRLGIPAARGKTLTDDEAWYGRAIEAVLNADRPRNMLDVEKLADILVEIASLVVRTALTLSVISGRVFEGVLTTLITAEPLADALVSELLPIIELRLIDSLRESKAFSRVQIDEVRNWLIDERAIYAKGKAAATMRSVALERIRPEGKVRGYTYQGVKGLQFEAVAVVDIARRFMPFPTREDLWDDARKLYVGLTRSKRYMAIHAPTDYRDASPFLPMIMGQKSAEAVIRLPLPASLQK